MKLKALLVASVLAISSINTFAEDLSKSVSLAASADGNYTGGFSLTHQNAGAFNDTITFTPGVTGYTSTSLWTFGLTPQSNINFSSATLFTPGSATGIPLDLASIFGGTYEFATSLPKLLTGPFTLKVAGVAGSSATYTGSMNISPVPEAETYAMMTLGLGLLGFLARRKKASGSSKDRTRLVEASAA